MDSNVCPRNQSRAYERDEENDESVKARTQAGRIGNAHHSEYPFSIATSLVLSHNPFVCPHILPYAKCTLSLSRSFLSFRFMRIFVHFAGWVNKSAKNALEPVLWQKKNTPNTKTTRFADLRNNDTIHCEFCLWPSTYTVHFASFAVRHFTLRKCVCF